MPPTQNHSVRVGVRRAIASDAGELARLCGQLAYPNTPEAVGERLARLVESERTRIFVAELEGAPGRLVGWIQVQLLELLVSDTGAAIVGLVVDAAQRKLGVGRRLVQRAEAWALERGCATVVVRSRDHRKPAHSFYERLGYRIHKTQLAFRKELL